MDAQAGVADLRYVLPLPSVVVFTAVDTMETTVSGMPTGDSKMTTIMRSVNELQFAPGDSGIAVTAALRSFSGVTATAVGDVPMKADEIAPIRFHIGPTGPGPGTLMGEPLAPGNTTPEQAMAKMRIASGLFPLPGRQVRLGESWIHTDSGSHSVQGMKVDKLEKTRGTYVADSVIDGRTLNVLRVTIESTVTTSGTLQGADITQTSISKSEELVLWDSTRHIPVSRTSLIDIDMKTDLKSMNMTTRMITTSRNIITAEAQN